MNFKHFFIGLNLELNAVIYNNIIVQLTFQIKAFNTLVTSTQNIL